MSAFLKKIATVTAIILMVIFISLRFEWPLPGWAIKILNKKASELSIDLKYQDAFFDLLGNIRLVNVHGHYQGLLDFSAPQILVRALATPKTEIVVDSGELHTGFLQLPIPETIQFSGTFQKLPKGIFFRDARFKANSLVLLLHGSYQESIPSPRTSSNEVRTSFFSESSPAEKALAAFLEKLCNDKTLWVAHLEIDQGSGGLVLAGPKLEFGSYTVASPVLNIQNSLSRILLSGDEIDFPGGYAHNIEISYNSQEKNLWRFIATNAKIQNTELSTISGMAELPLKFKDDLENINNFNAVVTFPAGGKAFVDKAHLCPLLARFWGSLPEDVLENYGVKIRTKSPGFFSGELKDKELLFNLLEGTGSFYSLPFDGLQAQGKITRKGIQINKFHINSMGNYANGTLQYDFSKHKANYNLVGEIDPLMIPWFDSWWTDFFLPFGKIHPWVAMELQVEPKQPLQAMGMAVNGPFHYRKIDFNKTIATYKVENGKAKVAFDCNTGLERLQGVFNFGKEFYGSFTGHAYPDTLYRFFSDNSTDVVRALKFMSPPAVKGALKGSTYQCSVVSREPVDFYTLHFDDFSVAIHGDKKTTWVDSMDFGFADGRGGANAQVGLDGNGYGSFWIRGAKLGEWPLFGPLSQMLKSQWFSFATLKFHSADGNLVFEPGQVKVPCLNLWGDEHAATANGTINTKDQKMDFTVRLKTFGGSKQTINVLAPLMQPLAAVFEAHLTGPIQKPHWNLQLAAPNL